MRPVVSGGAEFETPTPSKFTPRTSGECAGLSALWTTVSIGVAAPAAVFRGTSKFGTRCGLSAMSPAAPRVRSGGETTGAMGGPTRGGAARVAVATRRRRNEIVRLMKPRILLTSLLSLVVTLPLKANFAPEVQQFGSLVVADSQGFR